MGQLVVDIFVQELAPVAMWTASDGDTTLLGMRRFSASGCDAQTRPFRDWLGSSTDSIAVPRYPLALAFSA